MTLPLTAGGTRKERFALKMAGQLKKSILLAACVGVAAGGITFAGAGVASADTYSCSDVLRAGTNGNVPNDLPQQGNKLIGASADIITCTVVQTNRGINGSDNLPRKRQHRQ